MPVLPEAKQGTVSKQVRNHANVTCLREQKSGEILFPLFFNLYIARNIPKSLQYGNHASLKGMKGKFNKEIPKSSD